MIRLLLVCVLCSGLSIALPAQSIDAWIEQLAVLKTLQGTIRQGYSLMDGGLDSIGVLRREEFQLHTGYFGSLDRVKPAITADARLVDLRQRMLALKRRIQTTLDYWQGQPILSP